MEAAWVNPDFDLSGYTRIMLMPTAVHFRDVPEKSTKEPLNKSIRCCDTLRNLLISMAHSIEHLS